DYYCQSSDISQSAVLF
nr:immunoglobulin light chain junction region [Macaca mulatta]MOX69496.1 immunoglobulin light chain junction region [Macaca mulatta]MOX69585.1 immunoglobulin light chain junction region [Macaca mulatta]MOX69672.1 immunoglobulin light chain junction region [Macaca mulatta]MOX70016.1 immunoglobulin light chain junction region [Macaca mulatta]